MPKARRVILSILSHIELALLEVYYGTKRRPNSYMFKRNYSRKIGYTAAECKEDRSVSKIRLKMDPSEAEKTIRALVRSAQEWIQAKPRRRSER